MTKLNTRRQFKFILEPTSSETIVQAELLQRRFSHSAGRLSVI